MTTSAVTIVLPGGCDFVLHVVPGGRFRMGADDGRDDERPAHLAEVDAFLLGATPVTRAQYAPFLAAGLADAPPWWTHAAFDGAQQPVVGVTWHEAEAYAAWLGEHADRRARLPTEAEWERAARGGSETELTAAPEEVPEGALTGPWSVGRGQPNAYGLLDMGTIVHEWCADWYAPDYYVTSPVAQPRGPDAGTRRASRGGSWRHQRRWSPPAARSSLPPQSRYADYGFRVLALEQTLRDGLVPPVGHRRLDGARSVGTLDPSPTVRKPSGRSHPARTPRSLA
jgi:formylglycine-generating enzyme